MRNPVSPFPDPTDHLSCEFKERLVLVVQRRKQVVSLSPHSYLAPFKQYMSEWNALVSQDRRGEKILGDTPTSREYLSRRKQSTNPLRKKSWKRITSIPLTKELRANLKSLVNVDWRKVTKPRLIRHGSHVKFTFVKAIHLHRNLNHDPRLSNVGLCLTDQGLTMQILSPSDQPQALHIQANQLTKKAINRLVKQMHGRIHVVGLDPIVPPSMREIKTYLVRRLRNIQAEGAIVFRSPNRVSLGEKYLNHPSWQRKLVKRWTGCFTILGLTGQPLVAQEQNGGLVTGPSDKSVHPLIRANDTIQTVMAKLDLQHSATFLHSRDRQRVQTAFHRYRRRTIKATAAKWKGPRSTPNNHNPL